MVLFDELSWIIPFRASSLYPKLKSDRIFFDFRLYFGGWRGWFEWLFVPSRGVFSSNWELQSCSIEVRSPFRVWGIWDWAVGGMQVLRAGILSRVALLTARRRPLARDASSKLFVGGLSYDTNETVLKDTFDQHGEIIEVKVICHRVRGKSKGFGFIQFSSESEASSALQKMDGQLLDGRNIRVHYANKGWKVGNLVWIRSDCK